MHFKQTKRHRYATAAHTVATKIETAWDARIPFQAARIMKNFIQFCRELAYLCTKGNFQVETANLRKQGEPVKIPYQVAVILHLI